jgi:WLM domain-containing protein
MPLNKRRIIRIGTWHPEYQPSPPRVPQQRVQNVCATLATVLPVDPTPLAQTALLAELRSMVEPLLVRCDLPLEFALVPGLRLRRAYGRCTWRAASPAPVISIRCTADGDRGRWRRRGAIVGTLLHEVAHLRYRSHGPRFWALHRRLVDLAAKAGVYDPLDHDPSERARGDEKLAASAAWPIALAARQRRIERARLRRRLTPGTLAPQVDAARMESIALA